MNSEASHGDEGHEFYASEPTVPNSISFRLTHAIRQRDGLIKNGDPNLGKN